MTVENKNAVIPVRTDSDKRARRTLVPTFPQRIVVKRKFESSLKSIILAAHIFPFAFSTFNRSLLTLKKERLSPEKIADWEIHTTIANHFKTSDTFISINNYPVL
jgi:hypothetical protein